MRGMAANGTDDLTTKPGKYRYAWLPQGDCTYVSNKPSEAVYQDQRPMGPEHVRISR